MACLVIVLLSVDLELYFLADQIPHRRVYINYLEDPDLAPRVLGIQVREESWGREGMSLNFACVIYVWTVSNSPGAGGFCKTPKPSPGLLVLHSKRFSVKFSKSNQPKLGSGVPGSLHGRKLEGREMLNAVQEPLLILPVLVATPLFPQF